MVKVNGVFLLLGTAESVRGKPAQGLEPFGVVMGHFIAAGESNYAVPFRTAVSLAEGGLQLPGFRIGGFPLFV